MEDEFREEELILRTKSGLTMVGITEIYTDKFIIFRPEPSNPNDDNADEEDNNEVNILGCKRIFIPYGSIEIAALLD
ncbi:hypothetical protein RT723_03690 [Psychrosphaera aquimarina]|uniref:Uncharacterized protein n=1 Tax=Psychrosphaera aquimarina TaxID=2044854 RepID=A0ABU3QXF3_9GAMM|nr:hypothetical protein [Psychrosphaera aquimarina]MDU0112116.1 hypothetical protein [Psychrosphaera aquimarina]